MLFRRLTFITSPVALVILLAAGFSALSEESTQKQEPAKKPEAAQEQKNILNYRAYRPSDSIFKSQGVDLPDPVVQPPPSSAPRTSKQERELLDREKNWIFVRPGDERSSPDSTLGVNETFDGANSKSVIMKFLEDKPTADSKVSGANEPVIGREQYFGTTPVYGLGSRNPTGPGSLVQPETTVDNLFGTHAPQRSLAERWQELHGPRSEKLREERQIRMGEFESLFGAHNIGTLENNLNSQPAASTGGRELFNRNTPSTPSAFRNPTFPSVGASSSVPSQINPRNFDSSPAPSVTAEPARRTPPPAILSIPKRHF